MARKPDTPCAGCGVLLWRGSTSLPPGQMMCRPCRLALPVTNHGVGGYKRGCRCDTCRAKQNARLLAQYHRTKTYRPERSCRSCGALFVADVHTRWSCSDICATSLRRRNKANRRARLRNAFVETVDPRSIFERDKWRCHICRRKLRPGVSVPNLRAATLDHLIPLDRGGTHEPANVKTACYSCNCVKGNRGGNEQLLLIG